MSAYSWKDHQFYEKPINSVKKPIDPATDDYVRDFIERNLRKAADDSGLYEGLSSGIKFDPINPEHYQKYGVEVIEITQHLDFLLGNVVKYVARADHKGTKLTDLKKAAWYLNRAIAKEESK
jgi:hypothetical protein